MSKIKNRLLSMPSIERITKSCREKLYWLRLRRRKKRKSSPKFRGYGKSKLRLRLMRKIKNGLHSMQSIERITKS